MLEHEPAIRLACFWGVFVVMAVWESFAARRPREGARLQRWPANIGLSILSSLLTRAVAASGAVGFALWAEKNRWGLFYHLSTPPWLNLILTLILLDLLIYAQHVAAHRFPYFWKLHRVHHADVDVDVSTAIRFHPLEILVSLGIKGVAVLVLGAPAVGVMLFEVWLNATALFNHSNVQLPPRIDRLLRWFLVTPDMHRVHHSVDCEETDSNFGFSLPWWDRWFGTYRDQPRAGHERMQLGLAEFREPNERRLLRLLSQPFR